MPFPFTDLTAAKLRPALVVYEGEKDIVVAFISSKIPSELSEIERKGGLLKTIKWFLEKGKGEFAREHKYIKKKNKRK